MIKLAIYGKGGIGKSTMTGNLAAAFAAAGQAGHSDRLRPQGGFHHQPAGRHTGAAGDGVSPAVRPGAGVHRRDCAGGLRPRSVHRNRRPHAGPWLRGTRNITTFSLLEDLKLFETYNPDVVLYDVLGDVVCGGFAAPIREGYAEQVLIVTSGEKMALYAANNIYQRGAEFCRPELRHVRGIILNRRNVPDEEKKVRAFAERGTAHCGGYPSQRRHQPL
jgi:nitrogenase iron protein NifH